MARTQSKLYPEIRMSILRSAAKLFAEKGFSTTTIFDLAEACNSSRGALYHYFPSKEVILTNVIEEHVSTMLEMLTEIGEQRLEPKEHLKVVARTIMRMNADNKSEQIVLLNDWNQIEEKKQIEIGTMQRRIVAIIRDILARLDTQHRMTARHTSTYVMSLMGSLNYTYAWFDPNGTVTAEDYADQVIDVFLNGFLAEPS